MTIEICDVTSSHRPTFSVAQRVSVYWANVATGVMLQYSVRVLEHQLLEVRGVFVCELI